MTFIRVLGDLFQLSVDLEGGVDSVRLSIPPPVDADNPENYVVPPTIEMQDDGTVKPVDYELRDEEEDSVFYPDVRRSARPNTPREQDRNLGTEPSQ